MCLQVRAGNPFIHDWTYEESVSCVVMQAELLFISRDLNAICYYLPYFLRLSNFVEERRDGVNNLFAVYHSNQVSPKIRLDLGFNPVENRCNILNNGTLQLLPDPKSKAAADQR